MEVSLRTEGGPGVCMTAARIIEGVAIVEVGGLGKACGWWSCNLSAGERVLR